MDDQVQAQSTEAFLTKLGDDLSARDGVDANLAKILKEHLLTVAPANEAVAKAMAAIVKLAGERASQADCGTIDG
ncbi:hypothetical protein [Cupriavidus sp. UME77]|uniref:hypothetical protein n=1 Tax=Cupriavidus sp. UME77 TaxID=1862321 RepID=UPI001600BBAD|nr:hypothetical protein [Cupriavidus sp. UME77]MBB1634932.1 hypothetical protein [Cupriavidus sp. UME77]